MAMDPTAPIKYSPSLNLFLFYIYEAEWMQSGFLETHEQNWSKLKLSIKQLIA